MSTEASDHELAQLISEHANGKAVLVLSRRPYRYATSAPLEVLEVRMSDGSELTLILKDLCRDHMLEGARAAKPTFLHQPCRELETYRQILGPAGIGPRCIATVSQSNPERHWLVIEKVPGVELWQVGELAVWEEVARWLGRFHSYFTRSVPELRSQNRYLLEYSEEWFRSWCVRADAALAESQDSRAPGLRAVLRGYGSVIAAFVQLPRTLVHGELYPSNVLVVREERPLRVCPVDWEMAAIGSGLFDLGALIGGWGRNEQQRLKAAYLSGLPSAEQSAMSTARLDDDLARCRLHLALQWIGWSDGWHPPEEHRHDWIGEALALGEELRLT